MKEEDKEKNIEKGTWYLVVRSMGRAKAARGRCKKIKILILSSIELKKMGDKSMQRSDTSSPAGTLSNT